MTYIILANNNFKQPVRLRTAYTIAVIAVPSLTVLAALCAVCATRISAVLIRLLIHPRRDVQL